MSQNPAHESGFPVKEVFTEAAPRPVGPYSQAVTHAGTVYVSGQIPLRPSDSQMVEGEIEEQTEQVIANLSEVLREAGSGLDQVLRTTVYLTDLTLFPRVNAVYARHFKGVPAPARATVGVSALPLGAQVEIDAIAFCQPSGAESNETSA